MAIASADVFTAISQCYCAELPATVLEIVATEPSSVIGRSYQRYVRSNQRSSATSVSTYLPGLRRIAAVLWEHAAAIEWPSMAWLKERTRPGLAPTGLISSHTCGWPTRVRGTSRARNVLATSRVRGNSNKG